MQIKNTWTFFACFILLAGGLMYGNCGTSEQSNVISQDNLQVTTKVLGNEGKNNFIATLKDGTKVTFKVPGVSTYKVTLKDGSKVSFLGRKAVK